MKRVLGVILAVVFLVGCSVDSIKSVPPMTMEEVAGRRLAQLSNDEREGLIYQYVSDRIIVDKERLIAIESRDLKRIDTLLSQVESFLKGSNNDSISEEYANYLLMEFARTPYEWKQSKVEPIGFDPAARLYFVDVTYSTSGVYKDVIPSSKIPNGSPDEGNLKQKRFMNYIAYLTDKNRGYDDRAQVQLENFEKAWGSVESVMNEQQGVSLIDRTRVYPQDSQGLGKLTYSGLIQETKLNVGADMTFRYVFKYRYNLGEETDLEVESLYLKNYELKNSDKLVEGYKSSNISGIEVLKPFIDRLIISYHKAVEESNDVGLYQLFFSYGGVDKYYSDLSRYTYNSIGGYNFEVLQRSGTNVVIKVNRINKIRAKGAEMSLPTYEEELIYNLVLDRDDKIKIRSVDLVKSTLVGEPLSVIKNVSGVSDLIQYSGEAFTSTNKQKVEEALEKFSEVVFNAKVDTPEFVSIVDVGVSDTTLRKLTSIVTAVPDAKRKVNYIVSWDTKTNVYVSVTLREVFELDDSNLDTESVVDLVNRNGEWKVVNYTRVLNIKTSSASASTKNSLSENIR